MPPGARNPGALYFHIYRLADPLCRQALYQYNKAFWFRFSNSDGTLTIDTKTHYNFTNLTNQLPSDLTLLPNLFLFLPFIFIIYNYN